MKNLALKIGQLKKEDYDKKLFSSVELAEKINPETARGLKLCEEFNIKGADVLASEIAHTKEELVTLKGKTLSFRESGSNDEKVAELEELVSELEELLRQKFDHAARMETYKAREDAHTKAVERLQPLADKLQAIEKELKEEFPAIREVQSSTFANPINPDIFRLLEAMSRPGGVFN